MVLRKKRVQLPQDWFVIPTGRRFIVSEHQHGCRHFIGVFKHWCKGYDLNRNSVMVQPNNLDCPYDGPGFMDHFL